MPRIDTSTARAGKGCLSGRRLVTEFDNNRKRKCQAEPECLPRGGAEFSWMTQLDWPGIIHNLELGHPLKFLWEENAQHLTSYSNFWKQFYRKFSQYRQATVTAREFVPGERVEVDYAGDPIEWVELNTGKIRKAWVFVAGPDCSQLLFSLAGRGHEELQLAGQPPANVRPFTTTTRT